MANLYSHLLGISAAALLLASAPLASAQETVVANKWERCLKVTAPWAIFKTSTGRLLVGDLDDNMTGGIWYSDDHGTTWQKSQIMKDYHWSQFIETDEYIFALAYSRPYVARSADDGKTWITLSYQALTKDYAVDEKGNPYNEYGATDLTYDPERKRLYVAPQGIATGPIYTEDNGQTWKRTNDKGLYLKFSEGDIVLEYPYSLNYFKGKVFMGGLYAMSAYDADTDTWTQVVNGNARLEGLLTACTIDGDKTFFATSSQERGIVVEQNYYPPFIRYTNDGVKWSQTEWPEGEDYGYVRAIHHDGSRLYAAIKSKTGYYSEDDGKTWRNLGKGYEGSVQFPCAITADDKYVYLANWCIPDWTGKDNGEGIYRILIEYLPEASSGASDIEIAGIKDVTAEAAPATVTVDGGWLTVNCNEPCGIEIYSAAGQRIRPLTSSTRINVSGLPKGAYICCVHTQNSTQNIKFVK